MMMKTKTKLAIGIAVTAILAVVLISGCVKDVDDSGKEITSVELREIGGIMGGVHFRITMNITEDSVVIKKIDSWMNTTYCDSRDLKEFKKLEEAIHRNINSWGSEYPPTVTDDFVNELVLYFKDGSKSSMRVYMSNKNTPRSLSDVIKEVKEIGNVNSSCDKEFTRAEFSSVSNNTLVVDLDGYIRSCIDGPSLYIKEGDSWRKVNRDLPGKGMYYLDAEYYGYGMCDVVVCNKIQTPYNIKLVEYKKTGQRESLETKGYKVPEYETVELKGEIKVELKYFTDDKCKNEKLSITIIENEVK